MIEWNKRSSVIKITFLTTRYSFQIEGSKVKEADFMIGLETENRIFAF